MSGLPVGEGLSTRTVRNGTVLSISMPRSGPFVIPEIGRWLSLNRPPYYWTRPRVGESDLNGVDQSQLLLWETPTEYGILIPIVGTHARFVLDASGTSLVLRATDDVDPTSPSWQDAAYLGYGSDPFVLVRQAMADLADELGTFRLRHEKPVPEFVDWLGWCTWDAFYQDVSEDKLLDGIEQIQHAGIPLGFVLLDDGWLSHSHEQMTRFEADAEKFPSGLAATISKTKAAGVPRFGLWHAFPGYWCGTANGSEAASGATTLESQANIRPWNPDQIADLSLIEPGAARAFYDRFHRFLRSCGVDFVKVDGQSSLEVFTRGQTARVPAMRAYQQAMQQAARDHFDGGLIHCMCHGSDVAFHMRDSVVWRNSDDFFPERKESHGSHLWENAMTSFWSHSFAVPDWDMFWSTHPEAAFHAAARAISGGPVYFSDRPGNHDADLLARLTTFDGKVLRFHQPSLPALNCLFVDARTRPSLLKLWNSHMDSGVIGAFHCYEGDVAIEGEIEPSEVRSLAPGQTVCFTYRARRVYVVDSAQPIPLTLSKRQFELVTVVPLRHDWFAAFGLVDKLNGLVALEERPAVTKEEAVMQLIDGGTTGFYSSTKPRKVALEGFDLPFEYNDANGLVLCEVPSGAAREVRVERGFHEVL